MTTHGAGNMFSRPLLMLLAPVDSTPADRGATVEQVLVRTLLQLLNGNRETLNSALERIGHHVENTPQSSQAPRGQPDHLTARQLQVLRLAVDGHTNRRIAAELDISQNTVARHIANIYEKTGLHNRAALAAYAVNQGIATGETGDAIDL